MFSFGRRCYPNTEGRRRRRRTNISIPVRKSDLIWLAAILIVAAGLRVWAPWDDVFGARVNFLETDAWYHVRLAQNQVVNYPHRVTVDPYAAPNAQYVAVAPL